MGKIVHWTSLRPSFSLDDSEGTSWRERHKYPMESASLLMQAEWQRALTNGQARAAELFGRPETEQKRLGYFHTLKEICQQPWTWLRTCDRMMASRDGLKQDVAGIRSLALTGSGSSEYATECVCLPLQNELVTCNEQGSLARAWRDHEKVHVTTLPAETHDKSLVMTSSFTNLLLAARFIGMLERPDEYQDVCERLSQITKDLIRSNFDILAKIASAGFRRAIFLGSGSRFAASREAALKMLELTSGRVTTLCETYLGFRHGPMSYAQDDTLIVCNLSCDSTIRAYELDLLRELDRKKLGLSKIIVGENIPDSVVRKSDEVIECQGLNELGDEETPTVYVVVAQLLAFFRCLVEGLQPDSPSEGGIINRVVEKFPLHTPS